MVVVPCDPRVIVKLLGEADSVKFPAAGAVTVRDTVVVCVMPPPVPLTVMLYVPVAVVGDTAMPMVAVPDPGAAIDAGVNVTVTPLGCPFADNAIAALNPPDTLVLIVEEPPLPCTTDTAPGTAEIAKFGVVEVLPASALINPTPFGLPHPVTRSYPVTAEKLPEVPPVMS